MWTRYCCLLLLALLMVEPVLAANEDYGTRYTGDRFVTRSPVLGRNGMASTSHPIASAIAVDILKKGGSAIDAAIAANAMLGLVEPYACGIGGDMFAIIWDPQSRQLLGYNGSGHTPKDFGYTELQQQLGEGKPLPLFGALAVSVPGAVDGWFELHQRFGKLPMAELLAPAIAYARQGVAITEVDAHTWNESLKEFPGEGLTDADVVELMRVYKPNGKAPQVGEVFQNPDLADSYQRLADGGRDAYYTGDIGERIIKAVQAAGGHLQASDLASHRGEWITPVSVNYRGYDLYEIPPNSQGIAALQMLNIIKQFPMAQFGRNSADYWHVLAEASKLAYEDRARFYSDPDFGEIPLSWLLSDEYAKERATLVNMQQAATQYPAGEPPQHGDTTYLAVADSSGLMVSWIQSNFWEFGSGVVAEGTGFALQNRGSQFNMDPQHANVYAAGKRPFHTIIPAFLMKDGEPLMAFGVMGGYLQPQAHVQIVANMVDFGMNVQQAGDAARFVHQTASQPTGGKMTDGGTLRIEAGVNNSIIAELRQRGHTVAHGERTYSGSYGGYQAVWRDPETGVYWGGTEMRFDGASAGY
ncbi:MAG TPA: gamma-glutamyltransferase [Xanthomonadales bacterium]|nr:gamma-glutamyltransferase [Xanthomonadales bacterium]